MQLLIVQQVQAVTTPGNISGEAGLTPRGHRQAAAAATRLAVEIADTRLREIVHSGATGARRTAALIAESLGAGAGAELAERGHEETWPEWTARVGGDIDAVLARHRGRPGVVVLVCDAAWTLAAEQYLTRSPVTLDFAVLVADPASITEWHHIGDDPADGRGRWLRVRHNDTMHNAFEH